MATRPYLRPEHLRRVPVEGLSPEQIMDRLRQVGLAMEAVVGHTHADESAEVEIVIRSVLGASERPADQARLLDQGFSGIRSAESAEIIRFRPKGAQGREDE